MGNKIMLRETWCIVISYNTVSTDLWDKKKPKQIKLMDGGKLRNVPTTFKLKKEKRISNATSVLFKAYSTRCCRSSTCTDLFSSCSRLVFT